MLPLNLVKLIVRQKVLCFGAIAKQHSLDGGNGTVEGLGFRRFSCWQTLPIGLP